MVQMQTNNYDSLQFKRFHKHVKDMERRLDREK